MDYLAFLIGLALLVAGAGCVFYYREDREWSRWPLVTLALAALSGKVWFGILVFAFGWQRQDCPVQAFLGAAFAASLLGFRLAPIAVGRQTVNWVKISAVAAFAILVLAAGLTNPDGPAFFLPLIAVAAVGAWHLGSPDHRGLGKVSQGRRILMTLLFTVITAICLLPDTVETCYDTFGQGLAPARVALLCALGAATLCSVLFCWLLWLPVYQANKAPLAGNFARRRMVVTTVLLATAVFTCANGALLTHWLGSQANQEATSTLLSALRLGASNLHPSQITELKGQPEEVELASYKELRSRLCQVKDALPGVRFAYLVGMRNDTLVFLVDAEDPANEETFSPPGDAVQDYPEKWQEELKGKATFMGPDPDEWGVWFAGCVPVNDEQGKLIALLGIDYPAATWLRPLAARRVAGMVVTLSVTLLLTSLLAAHVAAMKAERKLFASRARADRLALVAQRTDNAVVITDPLGNIEWVNEGFTRISGYASTEAIGRPPGSFLQHQQEDSAERDHMRACIQNGKGFDTEIINFTKGGHAYIVHIECQPLHNDQGELTGFMAIERDVTEARRSSRLLEAVATINTTLLASHLEASVWDEILSALGSAANADRCYLFRIHPHPELHTPAMSQVAEWNSGAATPQSNNPNLQNFSFNENGYGRWLVELQADRAISGIRRDFPVEEQPSLIAQEIRSLVVVPIFTGEDLTGFMGFDACHEDRVWHNWEISILRSAAANIGLRQVVDNEAKALLLARDEARSAADAARTANRAKSAFLATMSHEIRTPLNAVIGMASLLEANPLDAKQQDIAETIINSSNFLLDLINDILDYSRIESGHMELEVTPFNLADICSEACNVVRVEAQKKHLELTCDIAPQIPPQVAGDRSRIRQILVNLLSNAVKFTADGFVRVKLDGHQEPSGLWQIGFEIQDSGIGIAPAALSRLFNPFVQEDSSTTRRFGGSGLGLAISKRLAVAMGGDITVSSTHGEGSSFRLELTLKPVWELTGAPSPEASNDLDESCFAGLQILVAEDNPNNQKVIRLILQRLGIEADCVANGELAVAAVLAKSYDVIVLDVQMPVMDGLEASRTIRTLKLAKRPRIVALTANAFQEDQDAVFAAGMDEFLTKPITLARFRQMLAKVAKDCEPQPVAASPPPSLVAATTAPPFIDHHQLELIIDLGQAAYCELFAELAASVPAQLAAIQTLMEAGDSVALKRRLHSFRGEISCFGCTGMTARLAEIEARPAVPPQESAALMQEINDLWERSFAAIKQWEQSTPCFNPLPAP